MKETRIPYSLPMARARRAGLKTQTRRGLKVQPYGVATVASGNHLLDFRNDLSDYSGVVALHDFVKRAPYGQPGDILLPTEPWRAPAEYDGLSPIQLPSGVPVWLDTNGPAPEGFGRYRHGKFMPKALIQARDELLDVRVERLQDISEADAVAEGLTFSAKARRSEICMGIYECRMPDGKTYFNDNACDLYRTLWEQINSPGSWDANPLVWVYTFRVITP
jgi:hypothetical protein